jgi:hypothetical protein
MGYLSIAALQYTSTIARILKKCDEALLAAAMKCAIGWRKRDLSAVYV